MISKELEGIRLIDLIEGLKQRGKHNEAEFCHLVFAIEIGMREDVSEEEVLNWTMNKIFMVLSLPEEPEGWDNFYWGRAAIGNLNGKRNNQIY